MTDVKVQEANIDHQIIMEGVQQLKINIRKTSLSLMLSILQELPHSFYTLKKSVNNVDKVIVEVVFF